MSNQVANSLKIFFFFLLIAASPTANGQTAHADINQFIDNWHKAAAEANADLFFGSMADDCIYIGTDAKERWTKKEFVSFAKPYFDKGKAWSFKPLIATCM